MHKNTVNIIETAKEILADLNPMTVRQVYYQLVAMQLIENSKSSYQKISVALVKARQNGLISWDWIDDRLRRPREVRMWEGLPDFADTAINAYRRNVWTTQDSYVEVWLEKDALSGIFEDILRSYGVTLNVGRGYDSWTAIKNAARRYEEHDDVVILYYGDFDPSGEDMVRSLEDRLSYFKTRPEIIKMALTRDDIDNYNLPPDFAKKSDTRAKGFISKHGDISVELDALPINALRERITQGLIDYMDIAALDEIKAKEQIERRQIEAALR